MIVVERRTFWCCVKYEWTYSRQADSSQLVDSIVRPDIISTVKNARRMNMNEDVIVLVMTANIVRKLIIITRKGVNRMAVIQLSI
ncbi:hypothetical protein RMCBS344292_01577 [Rhizopus microsporus]|nr:hypothetical protein RMCBS344292_01577 [Rhizopus microsporus]